MSALGSGSAVIAGLQSAGAIGVGVKTAVVGAAAGAAIVESMDACDKPNCR